MGCDASVLLDGPNSEKEGIPNKNSLRGFEVVDDAKAQLEAACPVIVSCADILAFAACDSSYKVGKIYYDVQAGCRDGRVSIDSETLANLPSPFVGARKLIQNFARKEMQDKGCDEINFHDCFVRGCDASVLLDGPNSEKECIPNKNNLQDFEVVDDAKAQLEAACPGTVSCADIPAFAARDSSYKVGKIYYDVQAGRRDGRVFIDSETLANLPSPFVDARELIQIFLEKTLMAHPTTAKMVNYNVRYGSVWAKKYAAAMIHMGTLDVLTGRKGEIRMNCHFVN
ncbi:hypothetical protein K7X08_003224 [Anisodus acutangulus]|uniref:Peroxidase n=1 Tax=Anisodus acutangulus TaxID=402998 RepID=A0A9Q1MEZ3_9SOLA|nr:hypothetical protein K7X08_003224 [Anisodus acutangulus]